MSNLPMPVRLILAFFIFCLIAIPLGALNNKVNPPTPTAPPATQVRSSNMNLPAFTPTIPPVTATNAESLARRAVRDTEGASPSAVRDILYSGERPSIVLIYYVQSFNTESAQAGIDETKVLFPRLICTLRRFGFGGHEISISATASMSNDFGESFEDTALTLSFAPETVARIQCNNLANVNPFGIADGTYLAPALINAISTD